MVNKDRLRTPQIKEIRRRLDEEKNQGVYYPHQMKRHDLNTLLTRVEELVEVAVAARGLMNTMYFREDVPYMLQLRRALDQAETSND